MVMVVRVLSISEISVEIMVKFSESVIVFYNFDWCFKELY